MQEADAVGWTCPHSGAPAYRTLSGGDVAAVGIFSGYLPVGVGCQTYFTDIWDAYYALPGVPLTQ